MEDFYYFMSNSNFLPELQTASNQTSTTAGKKLHWHQIGRLTQRSILFSTYQTGCFYRREYQTRQTVIDHLYSWITETEVTIL